MPAAGLHGRAAVLAARAVRMAMQKSSVAAQVEVAQRAAVERRAGPAPARR